MIWILSVISALAYRTGGAGKEEIPFANSQYRDIGCPILVLVALLMAGHVWYLSLLSALLVLGFIRTYHDWTGKDNMYLHGIGIGLSFIPLYWSGVSVLNIVAYTAIIAIVMGGLNTICTRFRVTFSVWIEELIRGFILLFFIFIFLKKGLI